VSRASLCNRRNTHGAGLHSSPLVLAVQNTRLAVDKLSKTTPLRVLGYLLGYCSTRSCRTNQRQ
jgi:hypothetical protein